MFVSLVDLTECVLTDWLTVLAMLPGKRTDWFNCVLTGQLTDLVVC